MQKESTILSFARDEAEHQHATGHHGLARNYRCAHNSLSRYLTSICRPHLTISELTSDFILDYQSWLWGQGISRNTSSCYLRSLHAIFNRAVRLGLATDDPFTLAYTGVAKTRKRAIQSEDIQRLLHLSIADGLVRLGKSPHHKWFGRHLQQLEFARDLFLFCFSSRGMTFVDLAYLRPTDIHNGHIHYARRKTRQPIEVRIEPIMHSIIRKYHRPDSPYLFPILHSLIPQEAYTQYRKALRTYNFHLQQLSAMLGPDISLSSYVSRHSWATIAYQQQIPISVISQAMGHDSERTTRIYLKSLENNMIDEANHNLLEKIFSPLLC